MRNAARAECASKFHDPPRRTRAKPVPGPAGSVTALPEDDPLRRRPDITLAREKLGWTPAVALADGLAKTIDWFHGVDLATYRPPTPNY